MYLIKDVLKSAKDRLRASGDETWSLDAELLVCAALGVERIRLVTHDTDEIGAEAAKKAEAFVERRLGHEPVQYILGHCEFMGLKYLVNKNVLIPRPDTEVLVEEVLKYRPKNVLDIGTGSGAIAVALAKYGAESVTAADISDQHGNQRGKLSLRRSF